MAFKIITRYATEDPIHDPALLEAILLSRLQSHLSSIDEPMVSDCDLVLAVSRFDLAGKVTLQLTGTVNREEIDETLVQVHRKPSLLAIKPPTRSWARRREYMRRNGPAMYTAWHVFEFMKSCFRVIFRSETVRAIGKCFFVGNVLKSFDAVTAEACYHIDQKLGRPPTEGPQILRMSIILATVFFVVSILVSGVLFALIKSDPTRPIMGTLLVGFGLAAAIFSAGLLKLPIRYLAIEPAGRAMLKSSGLNSPSILRGFAVVSLLSSFLILTGAAYLLSRGAPISF